VEFKKEYTGVANDIREALRSGVTEVAQRLAHTIKGVAGNFSATDLMIAASNLENGIRDENLGNVEPLVDRFERAMDEILSAVAQLTEPADQPVASDPPPINPSRLAQRFGELARLLEAKDLDAEDCLESIKQDLSGSDCQANLDDLENRIGHLDFENARTVLTDLAKQMGIALEID
jgi:HPt (histidine-containing phosphotransfer) domain-containing protein